MPVWIPLLIFALTFTLVAIAVVLAGRRLEVQNTEAPTTGSGQWSEVALFKTEQLSSISLWHTLLARFDFIGIMRHQLAQAGLAWSVGRLTLSMLLAAAIVFALLLRVQWVPFWAAMGAVWFAGLGPYMYVLRKRERRFRALTADLPDALDSMSRAMRAGSSMGAALEMVSRESPPPLANEFRKTFAEVKLGVSLPQALENLTERAPLPEIELFAAAVQLHSRTGGRLTDVLGIISENIREQIALKGEVRAMAAQGRATGMILTALPAFIGLMLAAVSPSYIGVLLGHPYGKHMIAAAIFCLVAAHFVMRRIVDIRV